MIRKNHVGFLGEEAVVTPSPYPASSAYAEFRIMPSRPSAELVPSSRLGRATLNSSA
jgi:hypothetical protein